MASARPGGRTRRLHVKRNALWLSMILVFAACETSTDPLGGLIVGGGSLTAAQATGNWLFAVQVNTTFPACSNPLTNGQTISANLIVQSDGTVAGSTWTNPISGTASQPLSGLVTLSSGSSDLLFAAPRSGAPRRWSSLERWPPRVLLRVRSRIQKLDSRRSLEPAAARTL